MSLEQYKDASRKELWDILQIQMQVLQAETAKVAEREKALLHAETASTKERDIRDLEQQQLAITRFANKYCGECTSDYQVRLSGEASLYVKYLEALKEQGE